MPTTLKRTFLFFFISLLFFSCQEKKYTNTKITSTLVSIDSSLDSNKAIANTIAPYKKKMLAEINTVLSYAPKDLVRTDGHLESSLGNLIADLSYERVNPIFFKETGNNIDFAMFNYGGIRAGISSGNVTNKNAFELMPFENNYVVTLLSGKKINELIQYLIKSNTAHPLSKQVQLTLYDNSYDLKINHKPFQQNKNYWVLTTNYLQSGGDNMLFFKAPLKMINIDYKMRHAIIDYFKSKDTLTSKLDGRIKRK